MAASYPGAAKSFSTKIDTDTIEPEHVNSLQDEVTAIESGLLLGLGHDLLPDVDTTRKLGSAAKSWDGSELINLNATNLASGTLPNARFPATLPAASGLNLTALNPANISAGTATINVTGNLTGNVTGNITGVLTPTAQMTLPVGSQVLGQSQLVGNSFIVQEGAYGTGTATGACLMIGRNSSGTGSPGMLLLMDKSAGGSFVWADTTGVLRINITTPCSVGTGDTVGTVVGTQTSKLATKDLLGDDLTPENALAVVLATPVKHFVYKNGAYNRTKFHGIIADYSPEFAMDNGNSFNPVSAFGYTVQAIKELQAQITELRAELKQLRG